MNTTSPSADTGLPSGENMQRVMLAAVYAGALAVAVLCSPAIGLIDLRPHAPQLAVNAH